MNCFMRPSACVIWPLGIWSHILVIYTGCPTISVFFDPIECVIENGLPRFFGKRFGKNVTI